MNPDALTKQQLKQLKQQIKSHRNTYSRSSKLLDSNNDSDSQFEHSKVIARGGYWWYKTNNRFFRDISKDQLTDLEERTTTDRLMECKRQSKRLASYYQQVLMRSMPFIDEPQLLRVLFRHETKLPHSQQYKLLLFNFKQFEEYSQEQYQQSDKIHIYNFKSNSKKACKVPPQELKCLSIEPVISVNQEEKVKNMLKYEVKKKQINCEIEREIFFWEEELQKVNSASKAQWQQLLNRMQTNVEKDQQYSYKIEDVKKELRMNEVLLYFKRGHGDKTEHMLDEALEVNYIKQLNMKQEEKKKKGTRLEKLKCCFETDCKICFCTESDDANRVFYCDYCNTSFHQACYGMSEKISIKKEKFYCDVCDYLRVKERQINNKIKKPVCQICNKPNFPMKCLDGHFYHVTCLVFFNLIQFKNFKIEFKAGISFQTILTMVVQNQIQSGFCKVCLKEGGMKIKCEFGNCNQYFHPVCAYLCGLYFDLKRMNHFLSVFAACCQHYPQRDNINQVYLRRFFCDYKGTSNKNDLDFANTYEQEEKERKNNRKNKNSKNPILKKGKAFKYFKCSDILSSTSLKNKHSRQRIQSKIQASLSTDQMIKSSSTDQGGVQTETRRLFLNKKMIESGGKI